MGYFTLPPSGSTAAALLADLSRDDPDFSDVSLAFAPVGVAAIQVGVSEDEMTAIKDAFVATTSEIQKNNALSEDTRIRKQIVQSRWPTDPETQATLIELLEVDAAAPPPLAAAPPSLQPATLDSINESIARAQEILDLLQGAQADADAGLAPQPQPLPAYDSSYSTALSGAVSVWITANGLDLSDEWTTAMLPDGAGGIGTYSKTDLADAWTFSIPAVLTNPMSVGQSLALTDGSLVPGSGTTQWIQFNDPSELSSYDTSLLDANSLNALEAGTSVFVGVFEATDGRLFLMDLRLPREPIFSATLGTPIGSDERYRYWSDGSIIYAVDRDELAQRLAAFSGGPGTVALPNPGAMLAVLLAQDGVMEVVDRPLQSSDLASVVAECDDRVASISNATSQWITTAQSQQVQLQEAVAKFGNMINALTSLLERWERCITGMMPGR